MPTENVGEKDPAAVAKRIRRFLMWQGIGGALLALYLLWGSHYNPYFLGRGGYLLFLGLAFAPFDWFRRLRKKWWGYTYSTVELVIFTLSMVHGINHHSPSGFAVGILLGLGLPVFVTAWIHASLLLSRYNELAKLEDLVKPIEEKKHRSWAFSIEEGIESIKTGFHELFSKMMKRKGR